MYVSLHLSTYLNIYYMYVYIKYANIHEYAYVYLTISYIYIYLSLSLSIYKSISDPQHTESSNLTEP